MESLGRAIVDSLENSTVKQRVVAYIAEQGLFEEPHSKEEINEWLDTFLETIKNQAIDEVDPSGEVIYDLVNFDQSTPELTWSPSLLMADKEYSIHFIPFAEVFRYQTSDFLANDPKFLTEILWELSFDGITEAEQDERIQELRDSIEAFENDPGDSMTLEEFAAELDALTGDEEEDTNED